MLRQKIKSKWRSCVLGLTLITATIFQTAVAAQNEKVDPLMFVELSSLTDNTPTKIVNLFGGSKKTIIEWMAPQSPPVSVLLNPNQKTIISKEQPPSGENELEVMVKSPQEFNWLPVSQQVLSQHIKDNYKVNANLANDVVSSAFYAGKKYNLDPLLILSIIKVESTFRPDAVSSVNAKGLMQVLPIAHPEKVAALGGIQKLLEPTNNIKTGAKILREYLDIANNSIVGALQRYNGSLKDPNQVYAKKVLKAREEFQKVQMAANPLDLN